MIIDSTRDRSKIKKKCVHKSIVRKKQKKVNLVEKFCDRAVKVSEVVIYTSRFMYLFIWKRKTCDLWVSFAVCTAWTLRKKNFQKTRKVDLWINHGYVKYNGRSQLVEYEAAFWWISFSRYTLFEFSHLLERKVYELHFLQILTWKLHYLAF